MSNVRDAPLLDYYTKCLQCFVHSFEPAQGDKAEDDSPSNAKRLGAGRRALCTLDVCSSASSSTLYEQHKKQLFPQLSSLIGLDVKHEHSHHLVPPSAPPVDVAGLLRGSPFTMDLLKEDQPRRPTPTATIIDDDDDDDEDAVGGHSNKRAGGGGVRGDNGSSPLARKKTPYPPRNGKRNAHQRPSPRTLVRPSNGTTSRRSTSHHPRQPARVHIHLDDDDDDDDIEAFEDIIEAEPPRASSFITARTKLVRDERSSGGSNKRNGGKSQKATSSNTKSLSTSNSAPTKGKRKFRPPLKGREERSSKTAKTQQPDEHDPIMDDDRLKNVEPEMVQRILNEVIDRSPSVEWDDIAGLEFAKKCIMEIVIYPLLRPDLFTGLRGPPKGLLLFGPPGTGKTLIGKAVASQSGAKFFGISASTLTSKWVGQGEKMVRAMFAVARVLQPTVIFIDEIDSILTQRSEGDFEASRRIKTEFLVQLDGVGSETDDRILVIGATNRPSEIDEAARRRLVKRLYIPLPDESARFYLIKRLMGRETHSLTDEDFKEVVSKTNGYSCSDITALCKDAALGPIRQLGKAILEMDKSAVRPVNLGDFTSSVRQIRSSVSEEDLAYYVDWNEKFGSFPGGPT